MRHPIPQEDWPESWKKSYRFDLQEVFGQISNRGYAHAYHNRQQHALRLLAEKLDPGARILDVAAAQGNFSLALAEAGYRVTWNDLRDELIGYVRLKHERGEISYLPGNIFDLHVGEPFDAVLMTEVIEHVAHPDLFLRKVAGLVRPGGCIVMTTPNGAYFRNRAKRFSDCEDPSKYEAVQFRPDADGHIFLLHEDEVRSFAASAGLHVDEISFFTTPLTNGHMKTEVFLRFLPKELISKIERASQGLPGPIRRRLSVHMAARFVKPAGFPQ